VQEPCDLSGMHTGSLFSLAAWRFTSMRRPFSMFPKAGRPVSPDGRFEVRDVHQKVLRENWLEHLTHCG